MSGGETKVWELKAESELRCEIPPASVLLVRLLEGSGSAEIFGIELAPNKDYYFQDDNIAIYTWYGCKIETVSEGLSPYVSDETPMVAYVNTHIQIEARRDVALANSESGPRVLIVGPTDSGKSTVSRILTSYAARLDRTPIFIDIDVGQGSSVPGAITTIPVEKTALSVDEGFLASNPLVYFYGHTSPRDNIVHYKNCLSVCANKVNQRLEKDTDARASGIIVNSCGWIDGAGYDLLLHAVAAFSIDIILVLSHDRLYASLIASFPEQSITIVKLPRSGGIIERSSNTRRRNRKRVIHEYFYGPSKAPENPETFSPPSVTLSLKDVVFIRHASIELSDALLPIGESTGATSQLRLERVVINDVNKEDFMHMMVAVLNAPDAEFIGKLDQQTLVVDKDIPPALSCTNVAGFMCIIGIDIDQDKITVRSPCMVTAASLPSKFFLMGSIKWVE